MSRPTPSALCSAHAGFPQRPPHTSRGIFGWGSPQALPVRWHGRQPPARPPQACTKHGVSAASGPPPAASHHACPHITMITMHNAQCTAIHRASGQARLHAPGMRRVRHCSVQQWRIQLRGAPPVPVDRLALAPWSTPALSALCRPRLPSPLSALCRPRLVVCRAPCLCFERYSTLSVIHKMASWFSQWRTTRAVFWRATSRTWCQDVKHETRNPTR